MLPPTTDNAPLLPGRGGKPTVQCRRGKAGKPCLSGPDPPTIRAQLGLEVIPNRLPHYRRITHPCLVITFQDDLVVRPHLSRELAAAIPAATYTEIPGCGHYGYLERPHAVNEAVVGFLTGCGDVRSRNGVTAENGQ
ncbi:alpha/beta fold hydrolase [Streptomyces sp. NBC_01515]|uniref:alpha/beta fold hydrolase n=1 Tax=Streptomyces sp. NBC_01515 TaxID=2903890 RepID=UPI00386776FD